MDPITASAAITAGASIVNGLMGSASASKEYSYARRLQKHDQAFQKEMRATAYQTTVEDMQKAGINPAVALSNGASQSQGGGGSSQSAPDVNYGQIDPLSAIQTMVTTKNETAMTESQIEKNKAEINKLLKEAGYKEAEIEYYNKYGVFPGATIKTSGGGNILGVGGNVASEYPVGYKFGYQNNSGKKNAGRRDVEDMTRYL